MADEMTTSLGVPGDRPADDQPKRTQVNGFTGEVEELPPLDLAPSPADQRILAAPPHTDPLPVLADRAVKGRTTGEEPDVDLENHVGPSLTEDALPGETPLPILIDRETPNVDITDPRPVQGIDVPPPNDVLVDEQGVDVSNDGTPYPGLDTKEYNESIDARLQAEADGVPYDELPEIKPPVVGDSTTANDVGVPESEQGEQDEESEPAPVEESKPEAPQEGDNDGVPVRAPGDDGASPDTGKAW